MSNSKFSIQNGVRLDELGPAVERGGVTQYFHVAIDGRNFNIVREQFPKEYSRVSDSSAINSLRISTCVTINFLFVVFFHTDTNS